MRQLVSILRRFDMVQVVKLPKIGKKTLKIFAKIMFSKLIKSPRQKIVETFLHG